MKIYKCYIEKSKEQIKNALYYLYPDKKNKIDYIINNSYYYDYYDYFYFDKTELYFKNECEYSSYKYLNEKDFLELFYILKNCKNPIIKLYSKEEYEYIKKFFDNFDYKFVNTYDVWISKYYSLAIINNTVYALSDDSYENIFYNIPRIDLNTYFRRIKIKNIMLI